MADRPEPSQPGPVDSAGKLPSARATAGGERGSQPDRSHPRGGGRRGKRGARGQRPTPARTLVRDEAEPTLQPDAAEACVEMGDETWTVRVLGRSGGSKDGATPLLLVGFWASDSKDGPHDREALVVGRTLAELNSFDLEASFARSDPVRNDRTKAGFFQDAAEHTGRT